MDSASPSSPPTTHGAYEGLGGDGSDPAVVFRPAGDDAPEPVASHADDPRIGWSDPDGVQAVAQAILQHHTGEDPGQAALEALVMDRGDLWAANADWVLPVVDLERILERP